MTDLYKITVPDGRAYIGVTEKPRRRFAEHCRAKTSLGQVIQQAGPEKVCFQILVRGEQKYIYSIESEAIKVFATRHPEGFNVSAGGFEYRDLLPSTQMKLSIAAKNRAPELAALAAKTHKGRKRTSETKTRISISARLRERPSSETRAKMSASHRARTRREWPKWVREKISATKRARYCKTAPRGENGQWL